MALKLCYHALSVVFPVCWTNRMLSPPGAPIADALQQRHFDVDCLLAMLTCQSTCSANLLPLIQIYEGAHCMEHLLMYWVRFRSGLNPNPNPTAQLHACSALNEQCVQGYTAAIYWTR